MYPLREPFWRGIRAGLPFLLVIVPFALLFGVVGTEAGLSLVQVMGFSVLVIAGASQFTAVQLMVDNAPTLIVLLTALAVNLRMAMYSASLVPWLGGASQPARAAVAYSLVDQTYALSIDYYQNTPKLSIPQRLGYFFGTAIVMCGAWMVFAYLGATVGRAIPDSVPLDFAVPITFLAMIAPALRSLPHMVAATVAVIVSLFLAGLPAGVGPMIAAILAMLAGSATEVWQVRRTGGRA